MREELKRKESSREESEYNMVGGCGCNKIKNEFPRYKVAMVVVVIVPYCGFCPQIA